MYFVLFGQMKKMLRQLDSWFDKATLNAKERGYDAEVLVNSRLAPDQLPLLAQVVIACDTAKLGASRLTGKAAPSHDDKEKTIADLRERVRSTLAYLDTFTEQDFAGADTASITQPRWEGRTMTGADYFLEHTIPNFFFHVSHTYAILRHNGVPVGKKDYLGALSQKAAPAPAAS
jgi:hypothetical protein